MRVSRHGRKPRFREFYSTGKDRGRRKLGFSWKWEKQPHTSRRERRQPTEASTASCGYHGVQQESPSLGVLLAINPK